jgi:type II secretory pathway component PulF
MFASVPTLQETQTWRQQVAKHATTPVSVALVTGMVALLLLLVLCPPFVQVRTTQELERGKPDVKRLLGWALLVGIIVLFLPLVLRAGSGP